jgi:hypothetical protein
MWWSVIKFSGGMLFRLAIALIAVADVFMFLLLFVNGISDPAPRGSNATEELCTRLSPQEDFQNEFPLEASTSYDRRVPGPVLAKLAPRKEQVNMLSRSKPPVKPAHSLFAGRKQTVDRTPRPPHVVQGSKPNQGHRETRKPRQITSIVVGSTRFQVCA